MLKRKVEVVPYNQDWPDQFSEEVTSLQSIFQDIWINAYHIGSTSIKNISAKPIIDILIEVKNIEEVDQFNEKMEERGYVARGENEIPGRRYFHKGTINRTHHVHIFEMGHSEIKRHLNFRDYLNTHPKDAQAYSNLKEQLARQFPYDIESYINGKDSLIKEIDKKAEQWVINSTT